MFRIAQFISSLSNPLVISIPAVYLLVYKSTNNERISLYWTLVAFIFISLIALFVLYGVKEKFFSNFDVSRRTERAPLFIFSSVVTLFFFVFLILTHGPRVLIITIAGILFGIITAGFVNTRIKASIHVEVFTSFAVTMVLLYGGIFWISLAGVPVVAWSRVMTKRHTSRETIVGALLGASFVLAAYFILKAILY